MPSRCPLFPLDMVLFPAEAQPLHIFEPRYRQMLADCLEGDEGFGITSDVPPRPGSIGTIARVRAAQALPDGRSNIVVMGERRFTVRTLLPEGRPYLVGAIQEFDDETGTAPLAAERLALRELGEGYRSALMALSDVPESPSEWADDPEQFSFEIAALAEVDVATRGRLLTLRSTRERTRALLEALPPLVQRAAERAAVHRGARRNGKGGHGHDIVTSG